MKSAQHAGFIDASSGRFVKPGTAPREDHPPEKLDETKKRNHSGDGNVAAGASSVLCRGSSPGEVWAEDQRKLWLDTAASIFKMIYKDQPPEATILK
jgi:hypothetical protein